MSKVVVKNLHMGIVRIGFKCPGCNSGHWIDKSWDYNGNPDYPTFSPSILVSYDGKDAGYRGPPAVCHSFVRNGNIEFLTDSTHALAGQTVELPEMIDD